MRPPEVDNDPPPGVVPLVVMIVITCAALAAAIYFYVQKDQWKDKAWRAEQELNLFYGMRETLKKCEKEIDSRWDKCETTKNKCGTIIGRLRKEIKSCQAIQAVMARKFQTDEPTPEKVKLKQELKLKLLKSTDDAERKTLYEKLKTLK